MRSRYKFIHPNSTYFVTSTIVEWLPVFTRRVYFEIMIDTFRYCMHTKALKIYAYVLMDNHFHIMVAGPNLSNIFRSIKRHSARRIVQQAEIDGRDWLLDCIRSNKKTYKRDSLRQVWQEGLHPKYILDNSMARQKINYIHQNPVKAGFVSRPENWRYSSAGNYLHGHGVMEVEVLNLAPSAPWFPS